MADRPIADYALLSDCNGSALVGRDGSIDWLCMGRFDAPSLFARILDEDAGHWHFRPADVLDVHRRYRDGTLVLETRFETASGTLVLTDALATGPNEGGHDLGRTAPCLLIRDLVVESGEVDVHMEYAPRAEYGLVHPLLVPCGDGQAGLRGRAGASILLLSGPMDATVDGSRASAVLSLAEGERATFGLEHAASWAEPPVVRDQAEIRRLLDETVEAWRSWSGQHQRYDGPWRELVLHSGRVLQGLTFEPTGAIVAAPTTSLPETVGGERNWDYRYTWVRDASLTLEALWVAACPDEAYRFFDFLAGSTLSQLRRNGRLQIMVGVGGEHDLSERELPHLRGWRDSRPVRIGNGAWDQVQLDVYGELLTAAHRLREYLEEMAPEVREFLATAADVAAARWSETDRGIWEVRGPPRHYLHSKLMCWAALDRAVELSDLLLSDEGGGGRLVRWRSVRDEVRAAILERGWSDEMGAFTQSFGDRALDASALLLPVVGFLPPTDPRIEATVDAVEDGLTDARGLLLRYRADDGLEGEEGAFLLCTFWLAHARALQGRIASAREVFERAVAHRNDVGLLSEEVDTSDGFLLGNFPQGFSHIGLINAAWAIHRAETGDAG